MTDLSRTITAVIAYYTKSGPGERITRAEAEARIEEYIKRKGHNMVKFAEALIVLVGYIIALIFIGWVFYLTRNPFSFALLLILPFIKTSTAADRSDDE